MTRIHSNARTTPLTREEIRNSGLSIKEIMVRYSISKSTAIKWRRRDDFEDRSHRPDTLSSTLTAAQEAIVCALRTTLLLPLDDLLAITRQYINPKASRSGLGRLLRRENISNLKVLVAAQTPEGEQLKKKGFKDYEPGYFHMDIKYLPRMPDEKNRSYLFVAIDRATRWVFIHIYPNQTEDSSVDFLSRLEHAWFCWIILICPVCGMLSGITGNFQANRPYLRLPATLRLPLYGRLLKRVWIASPSAV